VPGVQVNAHVPVFTGPGAALLTPADRQTVQPQAIAAHLRDVVAAGIRGVLIAGTTGRGACLTQAERLLLTCAAVEQAAGQIPVIVAVRADYSRALIEQVLDAGAAALLVAPGHLLPNCGGLQRINDIARSAGAQLLAYHHPAHHDPVQPEWFERLAESGISVKDSSGDAEHLDLLVAHGLSVYVGSTALLPTAAARGAVGALCGLGAAMPQVVVAGWAGADISAAADLESSWGDRLVGLHAFTGIPGPLSR
jgi:dihydrodipicolinate synthase/N-acetylneuraminate lyase